MGKPTEIWNGVVTWSSVVQSFQFNQSVVSKSLQPHGTASSEYSGRISFRMDWLDLLAVQGTLKSLLQHHSSKASILWCLAFFMVQLSHPYMSTGKTIALITQTVVGKVMSLLFNILSRFSSVQSLSRVQLFATPWITARQASLIITNSQSSLKLMSIESVMPSSHLILCHPPLLLPPIPPSIRVFSNESTLRIGGQSTGISVSTGVGCHFLLQDIFPNQGLKPGLPHCRQPLYHLSHLPSKYLIFCLQWSIYASICFSCSYYITKGSSVEFVEVDEPQKHKNRGKTHNYTWVFQLHKRTGTPTHYSRVSCAFLI